MESLVNGVIIGGASTAKPRDGVGAHSDVDTKGERAGARTWASGGTGGGKGKPAIKAQSAHPLPPISVRRV